MHFNEVHQVVRFTSLGRSTNGTNGPNVNTTSPNCTSSLCNSAGQAWYAYIYNGSSTHVRNASPFMRIHAHRHPTTAYAQIWNVGSRHVLKCNHHILHEQHWQQRRVFAGTDCEERVHSSYINETSTARRGSCKKAQSQARNVQTGTFALPGPDGADHHLE